MIKSAVVPVAPDPPMASNEEILLLELRRRFDEQLSVLTHTDAGDHLRRAMQVPIRLHGRAKAGS